MVVFATVSAQLTEDLCVAIPGDLSAKLAYLQQELKEHYPHVVITGSGSILKVHGQLQEIVDLHSVLDVWFNTRDRHKAIDNDAIPVTVFGPVANIHDMSASQVLVPSDYTMEYVTSTASSTHMEHIISSATTAISDDKLNNIIKTSLPNQPTTGSDPTSVSLPAMNQNAGDLAAIQVSLAASMTDTSSNDTKDVATINDSMVHRTVTQEEVSTCTETDPNMSIDNTLNSSMEDVSLNDSESHNIKAFIKSWSRRKKNQEVQTDLPEIVPSPLSSGRRRKPGTPRKAKAHIPVKHEPTRVHKGRSRQKPTRYSADDNLTPKRRVGRPSKQFSTADVHPQEMVPLEKIENISVANASEHEEDTDELTSMSNMNEWPKLQDDDIDHIEQSFPKQRVAKSKAIIKVGELAKEEEGEVTEERRGRKHKDGPCIAREKIEEILPTEESDNMKCNLCPQLCKSRASLKQHYIRCHLERKFQCMVCGKRYGMLKELASHKLTHNRRHQCKVCEKKFATQFLLDGHMDRKHLNPKKKSEEGGEEIWNRKCGHCDFSGKSKKSLRDHINRIHGEKTYQCPVCDKKFALGKDLNQHVKFHTEVFQCDECGKSLKSKLALKLHINGIHRGIKLAREKEYVCEDCGKICRNKTHFKEHVNKIHLKVKPFKCDVCDVSFYTKHALKCHSHVHSDVREFICDVCGKGFKNRSGLRVHRITHQDVTARPYSCSTCSKAFTQRGALVRHERIHSGDRPYKCRLCEASFNDYSILRRHVVGVHKIDDRALCGRVDVDPNSINRGRPKVPGPTLHELCEEDIMEPSGQSEILSRAAQVIMEPSHDDSLAHTIEATSDAHYALVEPAQRLFQLTTTTVDDHSYSGFSQPTTVTKAMSSTSHLQLHPSHQQQQSVELIQLSDLSPQLMQQHLQHQHQHQQHQQHQMNVVPISVVNDIVQNALYEHHHVLEGASGYTIGMPVFPTPTPTTVANMHMMQPVQTMTHMQQQQQQQQQHHQHTSQHRGPRPTQQ